MANRRELNQFTGQEPSSFEWGIEVLYSEIDKLALVEINGLLEPLVRVIRKHDHFGEQFPVLSGANPEAEYRFYARRDRPIELYIEEDGSSPRYVAWLFEFGKASLSVKVHAEHLENNEAVAKMLGPTAFYDFVDKLLLPKLRDAYFMLLPPTERSSNIL